MKTIEKKLRNKKTKLSFKDEHSLLRFEFGSNWSNFLSALNEEKILEAEHSLKGYLHVPNLKNKIFLDIGSGSGLFSLAARRLGAKVQSFDYDSQSVACTARLRERYFKDDKNWKVEQGSVLDKSYLKKLGQFDVVYSWGVLHHTGHMWQALENASSCVKPKGMLFIAIYNDQGKTSQYWGKIKKLYNSSPKVIRGGVVAISFVRLWGFRMLKDLFSFGNPLKTWKNYSQNRGMSAWYDVIDWVGGYPFEVAKPEEIFEFFKKKGFELVKLKTCAGGIGCNEFVFIKKD